MPEAWKSLLRIRGSNWTDFNKKRKIRCWSKRKYPYESREPGVKFYEWVLMNSSSFLFKIPVNLNSISNIRYLSLETFGIWYSNLYRTTSLISSVIFQTLYLQLNRMLRLSKGAILMSSKLQKIKCRALSMRWFSSWRVEEVIGLTYSLAPSSFWIICLPLIP